MPARARLRRVLVWIAGSVVAASLLAVIGVISIVWWYGREADAVDPGVLLDYRPPQVTRVLARDGTVIGEIHAGERRTVVPYEALPSPLVHAFLAAEDADFFEHDGLDWPSIVRATVVNLTHVEARQGASTITQQVIKNTLLRRSRSVERKSQEIMLAGRVEAVLSKRQIFEIYVNEVYFGEGRYGVVEAARHYFGKTLDELDLGEMATLAALPNAPGVVTCYRQADRLAARRDYVLAQMVEHGFVDAEEIEPFVGQPIVARDRNAPARGSAIGEADEFVELARAELIRRYGEPALASLGATVRTSVDLEVQREARAAGRRELDQLEARHGYGTHARPLTRRARERLEAHAPERLEVGRRETVILDNEPLALGDRLPATLGPHRIEIDLGELAQLDPTELAQRFPAGHAIVVRIVAAPSGATPARASLEPGPELALALADVHTGELLALIGGREFRRGGFDRARLARRQPGSSFKPVVYGAALRSRGFTAASTLAGDLGQPTRLREALAQSDNAVALALLQALGHAPVHGFARDLGLISPLGEQPSLALGTSELTPVELLTAYLTLARGGLGLEPSAILEIDVPADLHGNVPTPIASELPSREFGIEPEIAGLLTSMLRSVIDEGTGKPAQALGRPVAGKTGTTDEARDAWFAGFTADHVAVTWVGFDQPSSLGRNESGSSLAAPIWVAAMGSASAELPVRELVLPVALESVLVDRETGERACREQIHWFEPGHCTASLWGDRSQSCTPGSWTTREPYQRCVAPERWLDELFLPGTEPAAASMSSRPEPRLVTDADERSGPAPIFAELEVHSLSLFEAPEQLDAATRTSLRAALASLGAQVDPAWARACEQARALGWPVPEPGTRLRVRVRVDAAGRVADLRTTRTSGDRNVDLLAETVLTRAIDRQPLRLPSAAIEPGSGEAELELELVIGAPAPS